MARARGASFLPVKFLAPASGAAVGGRMKMQRRRDSARLKGWREEEGGETDISIGGKTYFLPTRVLRSYIKMRAAA